MFSLPWFLVVSTLSYPPHYLIRCSVPSFHGLFSVLFAEARSSSACQQIRTVLKDSRGYFSFSHICGPHQHAMTLALILRICYWLACLPSLAERRPPCSLSCRRWASGLDCLGSSRVGGEPTANIIFFDCDAVPSNPPNTASWHVPRVYLKILSPFFRSFGTSKFPGGDTSTHAYAVLERFRDLTHEERAQSALRCGPLASAAHLAHPTGLRYLLRGGSSRS